jgi:hypothetical protein
MNGKWQFYLTTPEGNLLAVLDQFAQMTITKQVNGVSSLTGIWSAKNIDPKWLRSDLRVEASRAYADGADYNLQDGMVGLVRDWSRYQENGVDTLSLTAYDFNHLLKRRIVAYLGGTSSSDKTGYADDLMKAVVRENLGATATDTARDLTAAGLSVAPDTSLGPSVTKKGLAWNVVLDMLVGISDQSAADAYGNASPATRVYFQIEPLSRTTMEFRTYVGFFGADRSLAGGSNPVVVAPELGNLTDAQYLQAGGDEVNFCYAGGTGTANNRIISTAADVTRIGQSIFGRCEGWRDARNAGVSLTDVANEAKAGLVAGRPKRTFYGTLQDTPTCRYGRDWHFGDKITVRYGGESFDCVLTTVVITLTTTGAETITAKLEVV